MRSVKQKSTKKALPRKSWWTNLDLSFSSFRPILKWIDNNLEKRGTKYIISPLILAIPPGFILLYFSRPLVQNWIDTQFSDIGILLKAQVVLFSAFAIIWPILLPKLRLLIQDLSKNPIEHTTESLIALLEQLSNIVGAKGIRFAGAIKELPKDINAEVVFQKITQPEAQLLEIVRAIYEYFKLFCEDRKTGIRVNLAVIGLDSKIQTIKFHHPAQDVVRSDISQLNHSDSAIICAIKNKKIIVVESIKKEANKNNPRFVVTDQSRADEDGSLICFPIIHPATNKVQFVLSIACAKPRHFAASKLLLYRDILGHFALRINLEYSLLLLKEITHG